MTDAMTNHNKSQPPPCPVGDPADCPIPHERRKKDPWRAEVTERMDSLDRQIAAVKANTEEIVEAFNAVQGFFSVMRVVGGAARWLAIIAAAAGIAWAVAKFGMRELLIDIGISKK